MKCFSKLLINSNKFILIWSREKDADVNWVLVMNMDQFSFYDPFIQLDHYNDFTPEMYISDHARPSIPRPPEHPTSMVQALTFGDLCPPPRGD